MKLTKILLTITLLLSWSDANFSTMEDMCEQNSEQNCSNKKPHIKALQKVLNQKLHLSLQTDGKWGDKTKKAVVNFQKANNIKPPLGYVGVKTKTKLDEIAQTSKFLNPLPKAKTNAKVCGTGTFVNFRDFSNSVDLKKSYRVYTDKKLLKKAKKENTKILIDVSEQRIKLFVNGKVALCSPCTTGAKHKFEPNTKIYRDKHTPTGNYKIMEKIKDKRSNIFGNLYKKGKNIYHGDRRKYKGSWEGVIYKGALLENWMRITGGGIGLHASKYVKRYPGTNGCIRLPKSVSKTIFKHVHKGTRVKVQR